MQPQRVTARIANGALGDRRCFGIAVLTVFVLSLLALGVAYLLLAATTTLLPGDVRYLGMDRSKLCSQAGCNIVGFITHNRAAYGGAIVASAMMSAWVVFRPLRRGEPWAWWALLVAGGVECGCSIGFIAYGHTQAYGFGAWHVGAIATATLALIVGLALTRSVLNGQANPISAFRSPGSPVSVTTREGRARLLLVFLASGFALSGMSVLLVALTTVFVPQDVSFLGLDAAQVGGVSDRLLPLVAHDRAEFGVAMMTVGVLMAAAAWKGLGVYGRSLWLVTGVAGATHFVSVIASHFRVGYTDFAHLAPVYGAAALLAAALYAWQPKSRRAARVLVAVPPHPMPADSSRPSA